ncbi:hypothetical protein GCM10016455_22300 [Aliiroseovarius zhejiangensis]|uniref:DUF1127 domain-containing protein n=1 Tax=Aliiroseovarius zhejiangensis TaxID=1632025 RepID=A0ABQ3J413_9RHOB|nr:DUF1127 domain-containing protein [Aliiroseovarius zhejiangensis]GHF00812.1 hypothetical protein GCM10016455_22300 [Aliiroseovarius zhejiangensis]
MPTGNQPMMDSNFQSEPLRLNDLIDDLVARHGMWRVVRVLIARIASPRARRPLTDNLSDHLRRDIGLPPSHPPPNVPEPRF